MEILRGKLTFPLLCLAVGLAVFGVTYTVLGESPAKSLPQADVNVNQASSDPYDAPLTPLFEAIVTGTPVDVRNALQAGSDPNELRVGSPALEWAIRGADSPSFNTHGKVRVLLDHGADPNKVNALGFTPMHTAAHHGSEAVMNALLDASGDPFKAVPKLPGHTPYESALRYGNFGAASAIETKFAYRAPDRDFLVAMGGVWRRYSKALKEAKTEDDRKAAERALELDLARVSTLRGDY